MKIIYVNCGVKNYLKEIIPVVYAAYAVAKRKLECKTVRSFAYSRTREQSNKRSGTRLKTEGENCYATLYRFVY